jgi:hypothetical protein
MDPERRFTDRKSLVSSGDGLCNPSRIPTRKLTFLGTNAVDELALLPPFDAWPRSKPAYVCVCASEIAFG